MPHDEADDLAIGPGAPLGPGDRLICRYDDHDIDLGRPARLVVTGDVDLASVDEFSMALDLALAQHPRGPGLVVDLRGLNSIGTGGVSALHRRHDVISAVLVGRSGIVHRVLASTQLGHDIPIVAEEPPTG